MNEFLRRQREAATAIVGAYLELTAARHDMTVAQERATRRALATPGGQQDRERVAVAAVRPAFSENEVLARAKTKEVLAAVAAMSDNWKEHEDLWDDLGPEDLPVVEATIASWAELREAGVNAQTSDRVLQASLESFASLGRDAAEVSEGLLSALAAAMSASGEVEALADEYLAVLEGIRRRLGGQ